jgi:ribosomal-protein-alanine N-acetyltransferase
VLLRRAHAADVRALAALEAACFTHPWTEAQMAEEVATPPPGGVLVLEGPQSAGGPPGGLQAYCAFRLVLDEMQVMTLAVAPAARRRGLARWLLRFAMRKAARAGARRALLELRAGNRAALALYASLGFRHLGVRREYYREPVEDALTLVCDALEPPETES